MESHKSFNQGQTYVTLSRITSINELYLIGKYNKAALKVNESAKREYERLRTESCFKSQTQNRVTESTITISLLNTRSFKTHFRDTLMEKHLLDNDILCLTETQLEINDDNYIMESALKRQFKIHFNSNINKFKSIAYGYSREITILSNEDFNAISIFTLKKQQFSNTPITLIYRSPKSPLSEFIDCLQCLVGGNIDIFLGDFNIDAFEGVRALKEVFRNYNFKVSEPTHLDGALVDNVYIKKSFENDKHVTSIVNNVYFSDDDAVKVQIRFKDNNQGGVDFN